MAKITVLRQPEASLAGRLRAMRAVRGYTLEQLAGRTGIAKSFIWAVERGQSGISVDNLAALAEALGVSLDFLYYGRSCRHGEVEQR